MNNKPTFKHDFKTIFGVVNIAGAQRYQQALIDVMDHTLDKAIIKDNVRYVNAKELIEIMQNTFDELNKLIDTELKGDLHPDNLMNTILGIVKTDAKDRYGIDLDKKDDISNVL